MRLCLSLNLRNSVPLYSAPVHRRLLWPPPTLLLWCRLIRRTRLLIQPLLSVCRTSRCLPRPRHRQDRDGDGHISAGELKSAHNDPANMAFVGDGGSSPWGGSAGADAVASASSGGGGTTYTADEGRVTTNPLARSDSISDDVRSTQYAMRSGSDDAPTDSAASMFNI